MPEEAAASARASRTVESSVKLSDDPTFKQLAARVDRLEGLVVGFAAFVTAIGILVGLFAPYVIDTSADADSEVSYLISLGFAGLFAESEGGGPDGEWMLFGFCFVVLVVVAVTALVMLIPVCARNASRRVVTWARATGVLSILVAVGAWLVLAVGATNDGGGWEMGPGLVWFSGGVLAFALLTLTPAVSLWSREK